MATVKSVKSAIKSSEYVVKSIKYILSPETKSGNEKCVQSSFLNCCNDSIDSLVTQFDVTRFAFDKNDKILAHHYVQSFSPNEKVTPELVHRIGMELAERVAPGFQVIVATHVDRDHIHNHFLINSVSLETGSKWLGNQATLKNMRTESDRLCRQDGLSVIDETTGLRGIDQATQKLVEQGKSWKVELCHALNEAKILCHSKDAFIEFMRNKGFIVTRYTDRHITFQKVGEQKKIRSDTLAKQFGDYYKKENLERIMGFYSIPKPLTPREAPKPQKPFVSEFEKYEKVYFQRNPPLAKTDEAEALRQKIIQSKNPLFFLLRVILMLKIRRYKRLFFDKRYFKLTMHTQQKKFRTKKLSVSEQLEKYKGNPIYEGNIPYSRLIHSQGENCVMLMTFMRLMGYSFESAIADIIDNSISAHANQISVRFPVDPSECYVVICDNGEGMISEELFDAMKYGSKNKRDSRSSDDLGRFDLGLKSASLSQCRRLSVISKKAEWFLLIYGISRIVQNKGQMPKENQYNRKKLNG